jgi:hypothetical protein
LWARLKEISGMQLTREELMMKLGAARSQANAAYRTLLRHASALSAST